MNKKIKKYLQSIDRRIATYQAALDATLTGAASASLGSAGNTQSYTRWPPEKLQAAIDRLLRDRAAILRGGTHRRTSPDFG